MGEIFVASKQGDLSSIQNLILNGTSVNVTDKDGRSLLYYASLYNHVDVAQFLIKQGGNVNIQEDKHGWSPLYVTAYKDRTTIADMLIKYGADVNAKAQPRISSDSSEDSFKSENSTMSNISHETALHAAAKKGHVSMATLLLENGANPNMKADLLVTPLHLACFKGNLEIAQTLLEFRANPNMSILDGSTPLIWACQKNQIKMVELLLQHGARVESATEENVTSLFMAAQNGCAEICQLLLREGANVEVKYQNKSDTPLTIAAYKNHLDTMKVLVGAGANLNATDNAGNTALHLALTEGHAGVVQYLLKQEAEIIKNNDGETVVDIAKRKGTDDLAEVFKQHRKLLKRKKYAEAYRMEENKNLELLVTNLMGEVRSLERHDIPYSTELIREAQHKVKVLENEVNALKVKAEENSGQREVENIKVIDTTGLFHKVAIVNDFISSELQKDVAKDLSERHLLYLSQKIGEDWRTLGRFLKLHERDLEHFGEMSGADDVYCIWSMLMKWRSQSLGTVTGKRARLKDALSQLNRMDVYHMT